MHRHHRRRSVHSARPAVHASRCCRSFSPTRPCEPATSRRTLQATAATRDTISNALLIELATLPISTSSGGFTYVFNSELGTRERASSSFGPFFVERALTSGRNQMSFGATFRYSEFDQLDGNDLRSGNFVTTATQFRDEPQPFDVETVTLRLKTQTVTGFANYGVTDRIDIGVAVPIVSMELSGERINTYRGQTIPQAAATATTTGVADMAIGARAHLLGGRASGLTAGVQAAPSDRPRRRSPRHRRNGCSCVGDRVGGRLAHRRARERRLLVGRHFARGQLQRRDDRDGVRSVYPRRRISRAMGRRPRPYRPGALRLIRAASASTRYACCQPTSGITTAMAVAGFKWNVGDRWLFNGNVLLPLTDRGLRARVVPAFALDYSFGG